MLDELHVALTSYFDKWDRLCSDRQNRQFFLGLKPTAVGWKVADEQQYLTLYKELRPLADSLRETWMNKRWMGMVHFSQTSLPQGIQIIKIMQRRPGSSDKLGLDHVDFYVTEASETGKVLAAEPTLKWSAETNDSIKGYGWLSVWFDGTEAKLKGGTVLDIMKVELDLLNAKIK